MAESLHQIHPKITTRTKALLDAFCTARKCSQGDAVDTALEAFLAPGAEDTQALMFQKLNGLEQGQKALEQGMGAVVAILTQVVEQLEKQAKPPPIPLASYAQLYPDLLTPPTPPVESADVLPVRREPGPSSWRGLFRRKAVV